LDNIVTSAKFQGQSGPVQAKKNGAIAANVLPSVAPIYSVSFRELLNRDLLAGFVYVAFGVPCLEDNVMDSSGHGDHLVNAAAGSGEPAYTVNVDPHGGDGIWSGGLGRQAHW
jgi:hypothetical protein